jgi:hypothetical protein
MSSTTVKTFRFKFSEDIMSEISEFARIHRYDSKDDFKEAWSKWTGDNSRLISAEQERLAAMGFDGDVNKKMYVSARYYFKNKTDVEEAPKKRRKYVTIDKTFIKLIDQYINTAIQNGDESIYKPANCFQDFIEENEVQTAVLVRKLASDDNLENADIIAKIKKTFKNRYFVLTNKVNAN